MRATRTTTTTRRATRAAVGVAVAIGVLASAACTPSQGTTTRVSFFAGSGVVEGISSSPSLAPDGRFVAFSSATKVPGAGEANATNLWLKDRVTGILLRANTPPSGNEDTGGESDEPSMAAGAVVAFSSTEINLVPGFDRNGRKDDVFHRAPSTGIRLVSVALDGGRGNNTSRLPSVSADGRFVAFQSSASDLVAGDTNGRTDIFVRDMQSGITRRVSTSSTGAQLPVDSTLPSLSADGTRVAFLTAASLSGRDVDGQTDAYVKDLATGTVELASMAGSGEGTAREVDLSGDGRHVAFVTTTPSGFDQAFVRDLQTGGQTLISHRLGSATTGASGSTTRVAISPDGSHVAFSSRAPDLVAGDTNADDDYFVAARDGSDVRRVSVRSDGRQSSGHSAPPDVSDGGQTVAFMSDAPDLVSGDTNGTFDVFLHERRQS